MGNGVEKIEYFILEDGDYSSGNTIEITLINQT